MNSYELIIETVDGEVIQEVIYADTLKEAKQIAKETYGSKSKVRLA